MICPIERDSASLSRYESLTSKRARDDHSSSTSGSRTSPTLGSDGTRVVLGRLGKTPPPFGLFIPVSDLAQRAAVIARVEGRGFGEREIRGECAASGLFPPTTRYEDSEPEPREQSTRTIYRLSATVCSRVRSLIRISSQLSINATSRSLSRANRLEAYTRMAPTSGSRGGYRGGRRGGGKSGGRSNGGGTPAAPPPTVQGPVRDLSYLEKTYGAKALPAGSKYLENPKGVIANYVKALGLDPVYKTQKCTVDGKVLFRCETRTLSGFASPLCLGRADLSRRTGPRSSRIRILLLPFRGRSGTTRRRLPGRPYHQSSNPSSEQVTVRTPRMLKSSPRSMRASR